MCLQLFDLFCNKRNSVIKGDLHDDGIKKKAKKTVSGLSGIKILTLLQLLSFQERKSSSTASRIH